MPLGLTPREVNILDLVKLGYTDKEIGSGLGLTPGTVKQHLQLIFARLQAVNRVDAVVRAIRAGYIQLNNSEREGEGEHELRCRVKILEPWAKLEDFLQAIDRFNKQNRGVIEIKIEKEARCEHENG